MRKGRGGWGGGGRRGYMAAAAWTDRTHSDCWARRALGVWLQQGPSGKGALECGVGNGVRSVKSKPNRRCGLSAKTGRPCEMLVSTGRRRVVREQKGALPCGGDGRDTDGWLVLARLGTVGLLADGVRASEPCNAHAGPKVC